MKKTLRTVRVYGAEPHSWRTQFEAGRCYAMIGRPVYEGTGRSKESHEFTFD